MAARKRKTSGILLYNLLLKEVSAINRHLPEDRKLSLRDRYKLITEKLYPKYKGQSASKVRKLQLRDLIYKTLKRLPKKAGCNVLAIPEEAYQEIPYYELDDFLSGSDDPGSQSQGVLPKCVFVMINAGDQFGRTPIFNTRDYDYYHSGVDRITNNINNWVRNLPGGKRNNLYPVYFGQIQVRPNKKNDADPESYYIEMILEIKGTPADEKESVKVPKRKKSKKELKSDQAIKKYVKQQMKNLKAEKSKVKAIKRSVYKNINDAKIVLKQKKIPAAVKVQFLKDQFKSEKQKLTKHFKQNILTKYQYEALIRQIKKGYKQ